MMHANNKGALVTLLFIVLLIIVNATIAYGDQFTRDDAVRAILRSERDIEDMNAQGLRTLAMNDSLVAAKVALERADFADSVKDDERAGIGFEARKALTGVDSFAYGEVI